MFLSILILLVLCLVNVLCFRHRSFASHIVAKHDYPMSSENVDYSQNVEQLRSLLSDPVSNAAAINKVNKMVRALERQGMLDLLTSRTFSYLPPDDVSVSNECKHLNGLLDALITFNSTLTSPTIENIQKMVKTFMNNNNHHKDSATKNLMSLRYSLLSAIKLVDKAISERHIPTDIANKSTTVQPLIVESLNMTGSKNIIIAPKVVLTDSSDTKRKSSIDSLSKDTEVLPTLDEYLTKWKENRKFEELKFESDVREILKVSEDCVNHWATNKVKKVRFVDSLNNIMKRTYFMFQDRKEHRLKEEELMECFLRKIAKHPEFHTIWRIHRRDDDSQRYDRDSSCGDWAWLNPPGYY